jgi:hypothetical protein
MTPNEMAEKIKESARQAFFDLHFHEPMLVMLDEEGPSKAFIPPQVIPQLDGVIEQMLENYTAVALVSCGIDKKRDNTDQLYIVMYTENKCETWYADANMKTGELGDWTYHGNVLASYGVNNDDSPVKIPQDIRMN